MNDASIRTTQTVFREVNERIVGIALETEELESDFLCECGRPDCVETVALSLGEYEEIRGRGDLFVVARDHCVEGVDRLVESRDGFDVVEQI